MTNNDYEKVLIKKAIMGDEASFETLIFSCKGKAYSIAFRYLRNHEDAMDVLQESFIKIYRHLGKFNFESSFDTWVYRIVINSCNDLLRKNKTRPVSESLYKAPEEGYHVEIRDKGLSPDEELIKKEESEYILQCLEKLQLEQKEILVLRDINGFTYEEISDLLKINLGTVKSRISRARENLKKIYFNGTNADNL